MKLKLKCRLSYNNLFRAEDYKGDENFAYNAKFLIEKGSEADKQVQAAIKELAQEKWKDKAASTLKSISGSKLTCCYQDGDVDGLDEYMVLSSKRYEKKGRPDIRDRDATPLSERDGKPYSGCYVIGIVEMWLQDGGNGKGVRCELLGVQFVKDGPAFSKSSKATDDDFEDLGVEEEDEMFS